jgi:hypothetical protein
MGEVQENNFTYYKEETVSRYVLHIVIVYISFTVHCTHVAV